MRRLVIDTNALVSALIQHSYPFLIVDGLFAREGVQVCISDELMAEYTEVLSREKFSRFPDFHERARMLLADIALRAVKYSPTISLAIISDTDDNRLLELAEESDAHFLITRNTADFTMRKYKETLIVTPRAYCEEWMF